MFLRSAVSSCPRFAFCHFGFPFFFRSFFFPHVSQLYPRFTIPAGSTESAQGGLGSQGLIARRTTCPTPSVPPLLFPPMVKSWFFPQVPHYPTFQQMKSSWNLPLSMWSPGGENPPPPRPFPAFTPLEFRFDSGKTPLSSSMTFVYFFFVQEFPPNCGLSMSHFFDCYLC